MTKKDFIIGVIVSILVGLLSLPTVLNLNLVMGIMGEILIPFILAVLTVVGLLTMSFLSKWLAVLWQIGKFIVIGGLNTFLDFGVLNFLMLSSGVATGAGYSGFKGISFIIAVVNSYFWNKYWVFESAGEKKKGEFLKFFIISAIGFGINVGIASFAVNFVGAPAGIASNLWANIGAALAVVFSLIWNFLGYKFLVFKGVQEEEA